MLNWLKFMFSGILAVLVIGSIAGLGLWKTQGLRFYNIQTDSMSPVLQPGDLAISTKPNLNNFQPGDIISYKSPQNPNKVITHRIFKSNPAWAYVITKGDTLSYQD